MRTPDMTMITGITMIITSIMTMGTIITMSMSMTGTGTTIISPPSA
jgi:hypothetical protein